MLESRFLSNIMFFSHVLVIPLGVYPKIDLPFNFSQGKSASLGVGRGRAVAMRAKVRRLAFLAISFQFCAVCLKL